MSWSPEEESFAAEFLRKTKVLTPMVTHTSAQLEHIESQIASSQDKLLQGKHSSFTYERRQLGPFKDIGIVPVNNDFLAGMIKTAQYLRRNIQR